LRTQAPAFGRFSDPRLLQLWDTGNDPGVLESAT
jgi:hypothetical protein